MDILTACGLRQPTLEENTQSEKEHNLALKKILKVKKNI